MTDTRPDASDLIVKTCYQLVDVIELRKQQLDVEIAEIEKKLARFERC